MVDLYQRYSYYTEVKFLWMEFQSTSYTSSNNMTSHGGSNFTIPVITASAVENFSALKMYPEILWLNRN